MGFAFEFVGVTTRNMGCGHWVAPDQPQWGLFGRLTEGRVQLGDAILVPIVGGPPVRGTVARFAESFSAWEGLPFYDALTPAMMQGAFCLCVADLPNNCAVVCPGVARAG